MTDLDLFAGSSGAEAPSGEGRGGPQRASSEAGVVGESLDRSAPLAARMRPRTLDDVRGQEQLLGPGKAIHAMLESGTVSSMILWGPPGSGKTTLARLIAESVGATFVSFSAVTEGIARVREIIAEAATRRRASGRQTILFCDEIHRFNKAQQDAFLPHVEAGTITLIGATTENPSFEIVRPLLSRAPVYVLNPLSTEAIRSILDHAIRDDRGLGPLVLQIDDEALTWIAEAADGDARRALGVLDAGARLAGSRGVITSDVAREALQHRFAVYDKSGEGHYNLISALHKSIRGSDPDAAIYWLARMLEAGEDPLYVARRLIRIAAEDVGLADPAAMGHTVAARDAFHFLGSPEGELALAQATIYLATAPKSPNVYRAWSSACDSARQTPGALVPLHLRNAPTGLMRDLGYGEGYQYDPDLPDGVSAQTYLPEELVGSSFFEPSSSGFEKTISERLRWWRERRSRG